VFGPDGDDAAVVEPDVFEDELETASDAIWKNRR
jgi:hypothetical protein